MNQIKMGKFISQLRKNKNLTQEELGNRVGVGGKSVSKWERGINFPDISTLENLSNEFGVSVSELLNGEYSNQIEKKNNDATTVDSIKFYNDSLKHKTKIKLILITFSLIFIFLLIFTINDYNKCHVYSLVSDSDKLVVDGYFIFNPNEKILVITDINYFDINTGTNLELKTNKLEIELLSNNKTIFKKIIDTYDNYDTFTNILDKFSINMVDKTKEQLNSINMNDLNDMYLYLSYNNENNQIESLKFKLKTIKKFSNNKLFY